MSLNSETRGNGGRVSSSVKSIFFSKTAIRTMVPLVLGLTALLCILQLGKGNEPSCYFPAIYNFGDSNSDTGGNSAAFSPNPAPNGEGFFHKPHGRDGDGRLIIDFTAERLKLPYLSPYLDSIGANFRHGANFASGGATIERSNESFYDFGISPFYLNTQLHQFDQFKSRTASLFQQVQNSADALKLPRAEDFPKALYLLDIGQNDLTMGFRLFTLTKLRSMIPSIVDQLSDAVKHLYNQGGRSFWIHNTGPHGCMPVNVLYNTTPPSSGYLDEHGCVIWKNEMAEFFNQVLKERVAKLRTELPLAAITYVDVYSAKQWLVANAKALGLADPMTVCCGHHVNGEHVWCGFKGTVANREIIGPSCKDPSKFVSWDGVHYTEYSNRWIADHTQNGSFTDPPTPITQACVRR